MKLMQLIFTLGIISLIAFSCGDDDSPDVAVDHFDRSVMLANWADHIIIPGYEKYVETIQELDQSKVLFFSDPTSSNLNLLRDACNDACRYWQDVSMFEIGQAETNSIRSYTNIFPTDTTKIKANIIQGTYDLELPSNFSAQGFPALDFLLNGHRSDESALIDLLLQPAYSTYLDDLVTRLNLLAGEVLGDWNSDYRAEFIANDGSSATSSVDKLVNDVIFYYERFLRAGKIGIPAGVFSGTPLSNSVEAVYDGTSAYRHFMAALDAFQDFFNGSLGNGNSLQAYLDDVGAMKDGEKLSTRINTLLTLARTTASALNSNFKVQIEQDNSKMLEVYDQLQEVVVLLKVDMMQALNIKVDFVDADGD